MRRTDPQNSRFEFKRKIRAKSSEQIVLDAGNVLIPDRDIALVTVVASSVAVTVFDIKLKRGGACHFIYPLPKSNQESTALFGLPACAALLQGFLEHGSKPDNLRIGVYGGSIPIWANAGQREVARGNVAVARDVMRRKGLTIHDEDVGGERGRKIVYMCSSNEIAVVKTDFIRETDWFPVFGNEGRRRD